MHNNTSQNRNRRNSRSRNGRRRVSTSEPPLENDSEVEGELTNSLDQGMAAVRQWIQSREDEHDNTSPPLQMYATSNSLLRQDTGSSINNDDDWIDEGIAMDSIRSVSSALEQTSPATPQHERITPERLPAMFGPHDSSASERARQRSLSEPDEVRIRNWLFQQAVSAPERSAGPKPRARPHADT